MTTVHLLVGTDNGLFRYQSDATRQTWQLAGPLLSGWSIDSVLGDSRHGNRILVGASHSDHQPTLWLSEDMGATWRPLPQSPRYPQASPLTVRRIWQIVPGAPSQPAIYYAGVDEAGLFVSHDRGHSWQALPALSDHPDRANWRASKGGLTLHAILVDPTNGQRLWVAIASAGILRSEDGGVTWQACNQGLRLFTAGGTPRYLTHKLAHDPHDPQLLYLQNIDGVYRSVDGATSWQLLEEGLPSTFGFPFGVDHRGNLYVVPLDGQTRAFIDGKVQVYRRREGESQWQTVANGLPTTPHTASVLRDALGVDHLSQPGVYFGTTQGELFASTDEGDQWRQLPGKLGRIGTLQAWVTA